MIKKYLSKAPLKNTIVLSDMNHNITMPYIVKDFIIDHSYQLVVTINMCNNRVQYLSFDSLYTY